MTVREAIAGHCSTAPLAGLSAQLIAELMTLAPGALVPIAMPLARPSGTAHLYLQAEARASLMHVLADRPGRTLIVNSAYRTLAEQLAVHEWYKAGRCGITLAALPGASSPHSLGIALDVQESTRWRESFTAHGWRWQGERDPMHYQFAGPHRPDLGALGVSAFQHLWNRYNPRNAISIDAVFGPETETALLAAPAGGWE